MNYYFRLIRRFLALGCTNKKLLIHLFISSLLRTVSLTILPFIVSTIVDAITNSEYSLALWRVVILAAASLIYLCCHHYNYWAYGENMLYIHNSLQQQILDKVATLPPNYHEDIPRAAIVAAAHADITEIKMIPDKLFDSVAHLAGVTVATTILVCVSHLLGAIVLGLVILSIALYTRHMRRRDLFATEEREHVDDISDLYTQILDGTQEVQAFNLDNELKNIFSTSLKHWNRANLKKRFHQDIADTIVPMVVQIGRLAIYILCAYQILRGEAPLALLVLLIGYFESISDYYEKIISKLRELTKANVSISRMHRLLNYQTPHAQTFGTNDNDDIMGRIDFKNVSFRYDNQPLLKDLNFTIRPHTITAVVGSSGSGKSTLLRLLLRLQKPTHGQIFIDDANIDDYTKEVYATNVSLATQKPFVFDLTIRQNLDLIDSNHDHQIAACKTVGVHDDIMRLEKGYDTVLHANARNLSADQKQLLALARTLLSKSEILLFDEVTATLDPRDTDSIIKTLNKLKTDHTILVVTHKPDLMAAADKILFLDHGRLVAHSTHKQLLKNSKAYRDLNML